MHKHFRMLSITQLMRNHGVFDTHTSPPGIWAKLHTLYNLEGLDEREDLPDDEGDGVSTGFTDFRLPEEDFGEMMAARRLNPEGTASPSHGASVRRGRFSEPVAKSGKGGKGGKKAAAREGSLGTSEVGAGSEDDESVARSSPVSQRSVPKKRVAGPGASRLSTVRGVPGSTKKTPAESARWKVKVQQEQESSEEGDPSGSEEESSGEEGSGSEGSSGSTQDEEDGGSEGEEVEEEEEEGDEDEDEGGGEEAEGQEKDGDGSPEVSTPRGGAVGSRRSGRGGGVAAGMVKTPAKRGGRKTIDSSVRRSTRKK